MRNLSPQERWNLSYQITGMLSEASEAHAAVDEVLATVGSALDFAAGAFWAVDELLVALRATTFWTAEGKEYPSFELITRVRSLGYGDGLPGTCWKQRQCVWFPDVAHEENFPRASVALLEGLTTGVAFPAYQARRVFGVFEFFSPEKTRVKTKLHSFSGRSERRSGCSCSTTGRARSSKKDRDCALPPSARSTRCSPLMKRAL